MITPMMIVVFWCLPSAPLELFNPHTLRAAEKFVNKNRGYCDHSPPKEIDGPRDVEQCREQALLRYMPGWIQQNPGKLYMYADCHERIMLEPLDLENLKSRFKP